MLDIVVNMKLLDNEKLFNKDKKNRIVGTLSDEIVKYDRQQQLIHQQEMVELQRMGEEELTLPPVEGDQEGNSNNSFMNQSFNVPRSGTVCFSTNIDAGMQTENATPDCPQLQKQKRVWTDAIKSTCALLSSTCGNSN